MQPISSDVVFFSAFSVFIGWKSSPYNPKITFRGTPHVLNRLCTTRSFPPMLFFPVHLASRVEVFPIKADETLPKSPPRTSTIYFYVGLDHVAADKEKEQASGGLAVVDPNSDSKPRRSLLVTGVHPELGGFEVAATVVSTRSKTGASDEALQGSGDGAAQEGGVVAVNFLGKQNVRIGGVKEEVERLHAAHRRSRRKDSQREKAAVASPFLLPDEVDAGSNVVLVQVSP